MSEARTVRRRGAVRRRRAGRTPSPRWRSLRTVIAEAQRRGGRSPRRVARRCLRAVALAVGAGALTAPFALAWGVAHASVEDYLGPHRTVFSTDFSGELRLDLGPFGSAYLDSPVSPVGVRAVVGGVGPLAAGGGLLSSQTLAQYSTLYADPGEVVTGIRERLLQDALTRAYEAEMVLLVVCAGWLLRRRLIAPRLLNQLSRRRVLASWVGVTALVLGGILAPPGPVDGLRQPVLLDLGDRTVRLTVDSPLLAQLLTRGVQGVTLLAGRQQKALDSYVEAASSNLRGQLDDLPVAQPGETMLFGYSDLHCNQAMTRLLTELVSYTRPSVVISSGDDTVNGTAAERACITSERRIGGDLPFLVATGNHDSQVTDQQMRAAGFTVLDGATVSVALPVAGAGVDAGGAATPDPLTVLGDNDPEYNVPFSVERTLERPESETQLGERLVAAARSRPVDVLVVHQPTASVVAMTTPDPPARLVIWGHMHAQAGPTVVRHSDGSWTVGMQAGTAGGVKQPTITSFSTPFSPPLVSADAYFYVRDDATKLITAVQPVHFLPDTSVVIDRRIVIGDPGLLPPETRLRLGATPTPTPAQPGEESADPSAGATSPAPGAASVAASAPASAGDR